MKEYQQRLLDTLLEVGAVSLGDFTLKSGRSSPYFVNLGRVSSGASLSGLADAYARRLIDSGVEYDMLFGPAYKGIPLVAAIATALVGIGGRDVPFAYDRKEAKDHGEGGIFVGAEPRGKVVIVDDVITAGTAIRRSVELLRDAGAQPVAVIVALDRCEPVDGGFSATETVARSLGIEVLSLLSVKDLAEHLSGSGRVAEAETIRRHLQSLSG